MAWQVIDVYIYDNTWSLITRSNSIWSNSTIWYLLSDSSIASAWITELSATIWWEMLSHDSIIQNVLSVDEGHTTGENVYKAYKYEDPTETITGFYLDWTEYKFGWWWWAEIVYCTQSEYDALPSSKLTDGKHYIIYE